MAPRAGTISVLGEPVGAAARRIAYVPQAEQVDWSFPIAVEEVVAMGRTPIIGSLRRPKATDRAAVHAALERVDMLGAADRQIGALGGRREFGVQRIGKTRFGGFLARFGARNIGRDVPGRSGAPCRMRNRRADQPSAD